MIQHSGSGDRALPDSSPAAESRPLRSGETLVFVYGTLLRGEPHHALLGSARFLGEGSTPPEYTLADMGDFPALVSGGSHSVLGEVYAVPSATLDVLDELEDHPRYYRRTPIALEDGQEVMSYLLSQASAAGNTVIECGSWRGRQTVGLG